MAFNDATCRKCGKRFGWTGRMVDKPACPKCGHKEDPKHLEEADKELEARILARINNEE